MRAVSEGVKDCKLNFKDRDNSLFPLKEVFTGEEL